ncbi:MAG TPA: hypothetical protein VE053_00945 [Allosphingosinicella sp.]|nr:hypothetical protein [Allosphingosinicella sp.]
MSLPLAALLLAAASPAESPGSFVERLYSGYSDPDYSPLARPRRVFAPPLVAAIREDARLSRDEVGYMDADPLCQCQDPAGLRPTIREIGRPSRNSATVQILLDFGGSDRRELRLRLVRTAAGWRVADVVTADEPSLLESLGRFNRRRSR